VRTDITKLIVPFSLSEKENKNDKNLSGRRNLKENDHLKELGIDGGITLVWILNILYGRTFTGFIWVRVEKIRKLL
jgi:hypothetical protein